jgi:hypothetical protein
MKRDERASRMRAPYSDSVTRVKYPDSLFGSGLVRKFMKVYNLRCELDHRFEGWFSSEEDFSSQLTRQHIECPVCESRGIYKMPSAPRLNLSGIQAPQAETQADLQAKLMKLARQVIAETEDVGERFVEEARRIHYKEASQRGIRGIASPDECAELADEGIEVIQLPLPAALKQPLQ